MKNKKFALAPLLALTVMVGTSVPDKAEALTWQEAGSAVVNLPDNAVKAVGVGFAWTVDSFVTVCDKFAACAWSKDEVLAVVNWLNNLCEGFEPCAWSRDTVQEVHTRLSGLCGSVTVCDVAKTWMGNHPGYVLLLSAGVPVLLPEVAVAKTVAQVEETLNASATGRTVLGVYKTYKTYSGVDFKVPAFAKLRDVCHVATRKCGEWLPKEARDPKRFLTSSEKKKVLDAVCDETTCTVGGKTFARADAAVDHVVPHSCGGATTLANSVVLHKDDNTAKGGCYPPKV